MLYRYAQLFEDIVDYAEIKDAANGTNDKLVLCHYPILHWKNQRSGTILLYGHTHNSAEEVFFQECLQRMNDSEVLSRRRADDKKILAINVGCMMPYMNYEPRTLQEILSGCKNNPLYCQGGIRQQTGDHSAASYTGEG